MFKQSTVEFKSSKTDLEEFEILHPKLEQIIKGLLRSYEGIFDYPCIIYEKLLAGFIKIPHGDIVKGLVELHQKGIIDYKPTNEKPQIFLLKNRMYNDDFFIDVAAMTLRKAEATKRTKAINNYVTNAAFCRSKIIGNYFGERSATDCGICDNCINNTEAKLSTEEFKIVSDKIIELLKIEKLTYKQLILKLKPLRQRSLWQVITFLIAEEIIVNEEKELLSLK